MAVKNDDEIKKSLDMLEAHTGPYDEKFAQAHAEDIHAMADRLNGKKDDLWERTRRWPKFDVEPKLTSLESLLRLSADTIVKQLINDRKNNCD